MPGFRVGLIGVLCLCILATGCQVDTRPRTVMRYEPGDLPDVRKARYWGEYRLYALGKADNPPADAEPVGRVRLAAEEWYGFKRDANGYVVATAAEQTFPLERQQRYAWQMQADATQPNTGKAGINAAVLAVFIGVVALGAVALWAADPL
jgi:hypothetical protein